MIKHVKQYGISPISIDDEKEIRKYTGKLSDSDKRQYKRLLLSVNNYYIEYESRDREFNKVTGSAAWL